MGAIVSLNSRRISGLELKTEPIFGHESLCFSEIQRDSVIQWIFKSSKNLDPTESGCHIVCDSTEDWSLRSGHSYAML